MDPSAGPRRAVGIQSSVSLYLVVLALALRMLQRHRLFPRPSCLGLLPLGVRSRELSGWRRRLRLRPTGTSFIQVSPAGGFGSRRGPRARHRRPGLCEPAAGNSQASRGGGCRLSRDRRHPGSASDVPLDSRTPQGGPRGHVRSSQAVTAYGLSQSRIASPQGRSFEVT